MTFDLVSSVSFMRNFALKTKKTILTDEGLIIKNEQKDFEQNADGSILTICSPAPSSEHRHVPEFISFKKILWVQKIDDEVLEISYVVSKNHKLIPATLLTIIENPPIANLDALVDRLMKKSYENSSPAKNMLIIINPHGGQGKALRLFNDRCRAILDAAHVNYEVMETSYHRHAVDIGKNLDINKYEIITCASGDGIPHEFINGLYMREDRDECFNKLIITQLPCGSGNAMSISCHGSLEPSIATLSTLKNKVVKTDLMAVTQGIGSEEVTKLSFVSQAYGIIADCDVGTDWLRFIGPSRFELGVTLKVLFRSKYPCDIAIKYAAKAKHDLNEYYSDHVNKNNLNNQSQKDETITKENFKIKFPKLDDAVPSDWEIYDHESSKNLGVFYVGKMPYVSKDTNFFPAALPNDGTMDLVVMDSRTNILSTACALLSVEKGTHVLRKEVQHSKILAYRLVPKAAKSYISIDGESFPFEPFQVEIFPGTLKTIMNDGSYIPTGFSATVK